MAIRRNVLTSATARDKYVEGAKRLKAEQLGPTTSDLGISGATQPVSTWDLFVAWHHISMYRFTPTTQSDRNAAHSGPVFLPWHRFMLLLLELQLQRVLNDPDFGLPYWDWAADGEKTQAQQLTSPLWAANAMGGQGSPVTTGPFAFQASNPASWRVRVEGDANGNLRSVNRGLRRSFASNSPAPTLPRKADVGGVTALTVYDEQPFNSESAGYRNRLEGWAPAATAPGNHNRVHVWVGGDMLPSSSPNDPVFYLNHCNVDRIWAAMQAKPAPAPYVPGASAPASLQGHRIDDQMYALLSRSVTPRQMQNVGSYYTYDSLTVA